MSQVWSVYPRPQLKRDSYLNLNGTWEFTVSKEKKKPESYPLKILVPFCPESPLSGVGKRIHNGRYLYYHRFFTFPENFRKDRVILHVDACDYEAQIFVDDTFVSLHYGGYEHIVVDITDALQDREEHELLICTKDDLRDHVQAFGKQMHKRGGMWYTPVSGIWQSVWIESVPSSYVKSVSFQVQGNRVELDLGDASLRGTATVQTLDGEKTFTISGGKSVFTMEHPRMWSPEDPYLYQVLIRVGVDEVATYFAFRTVEAKEVDGVWRICLNGKPYFFHGVLDQGYYQEGIFTPASPEGYEKDILSMKELGFNTMRKHIKVEPDVFYYLCDKLGMVVFQDMVNNSNYSFLRDTALPNVFMKGQWKDDTNMHPDPSGRKEFLRTMKYTVKQLSFFPCICYWTIFNEGWGQFHSSMVYEELRSQDSSRIIDSASGWFRGGTSDVDSNHIYGHQYHFAPADKPVVLTEFGGVSYKVEGHTFHPKKVYGYGKCKTTEELEKAVTKLYEQQVLPFIERGLCASIYTQVSDVEDEINGFWTYDREILKVSKEVMQSIQARIKQEADKTR